MSALPENTPGSAAADTSAADSPGPRRLHAVHPEDIANELDSMTVNEEVVVGEEDEPEITGGPGNAVRALTWLRAAFVPDSGLFTDRQPSIAETVRRARHGEQLATRGPLRGAAKAHGYVAAANKAVCLTWTWIVDHPARLAVFGVLLVLAVVFPTTRHVLVGVLTPITWVADLLHALN